MEEKVDLFGEMLDATFSKSSRAFLHATTPVRFLPSYTENMPLAVAPPPNAEGDFFYKKIIGDGVNSVRRCKDSPNARAELQ